MFQVRKADGTYMKFATKSQAEQYASDCAKIGRKVCNVEPAFDGKKLCPDCGRKLVQDGGHLYCEYCEG